MIRATSRSVVVHKYMMKELTYVVVEALLSEHLQSYPCQTVRLNAARPEPVTLHTTQQINSAVEIVCKMVSSKFDAKIYSFVIQ